MINFAGALEKVGRTDDAVVVCERALNVFDGPGGDEHQIAVSLWQQLGTLRLQLKEFDKAEHDYRRSLAIAEKVLPENHLLVASVMQNLGYLMLLTDRYEEAERLIDRSRAILEGRYQSHANYSAALAASALVTFLRKGPEEGCKALFESAKAT